MQIIGYLQNNVSSLSSLWPQYSHRDSFIMPDAMFKNCECVEASSWEGCGCLAPALPPGRPGRHGWSTEAQSQWVGGVITKPSTV